MTNDPGGFDPARLAEKIGVSRVANVTGLDRIGVPVASAVRPITRNLSVSFGKGLDWESARMSAIMESAEYYFSERPPADIRIASFTELAAENTIDVTALEVDNAVGDIRRETMGWVKGHDLAADRPIWVPAELLDMDYAVEARRRKRRFKPGPTGLAAHFDRNLAIRHGLLEVIERDAHQSWNLGPDGVRGRSRVDPRSADHPAIAGFLDRIAAAGLSVFTWDMTPPAGIACIAFMTRFVTTCCI
jgi:ribosomal protein S12 methylthiotransferase accessory factor